MITEIIVSPTRLSTGLDPRFPLIGLVSFEEKSPYCNDEKHIHNDEYAEVLKVLTYKIAMNDDKHQDKVHEPMEVTPIPWDQNSE